MNKPTEYTDREKDMRVSALKAGTLVECVQLRILTAQAVFTEELEEVKKILDKVIAQLALGGHGE
jgi:DNA transposition AAA+ family ATPase